MAPENSPDAPVETLADRCWPVLLGVAPRLLSLLDREPRSPTRGSFDRVNWAWKFRDFPLTMWQASMMPLATLYRHPRAGNPYAGNAQVADWLVAALGHTLSRQHGNGSFDSFTPFSQDHGVTLAMVLTVCTTVELLGDALPDGWRDQVAESVARACRFAARSEEDYAFISNHQSAFALAYLRAARLTGDTSLARRGEAVVSEIIAHQSPDGWYAEYGGPDPGYETFGLTYLSLFEAERPNTELRASLDRSVAFLSHCVHLDGSIGGHYGSRNTGQFAPGGLAVLAPRSPLAAAIAEFVGQRLARGNVVTPLSSDDDNLPLLTYSYAVAATHPWSAAHATPDDSTSARLPLLPCEREDLAIRFPDSGIVVASTPRYFAVTNLSKGGAIRVFSRPDETLAYEDAGYVLTSAAGDWSSQLLGESTPEPAAGHGSPPVTNGGGTTHRVTTRFSAVKRELLTPARFLVLRILNLTVFRSVRLGALVRRAIIGRLITGRKRGPWTLRRSVTLEPERVVLHDEVVPDGAQRVTFASLERSLLPIHMGSSKYFHANELRDVTRPSLAGWAAALSEGMAVELSQELDFTGGKGSYRHQIGITSRTALKERTTA